MSLKYILTRIDIAEPNPSKPRSYAVTMLAYSRYAKRFTGPVVLEIDGDVGPSLSVPEANRRVRQKLKVAQRGFRIRVHPDTGPHIAIRKVWVEDPLEPANIYATDSIRLIYAWIFEKFDFVYNNGLYVNKPGLHGTTPPDAFDAGVHYTYDQQAHERVMQIFNALRTEAIRYNVTSGKQGLPINGAIGMYSIFGPSGSTIVRPYGGDPHVTHCHVSGSPVPYGYPGWI